MKGGLNSAVEFEHQFWALNEAKQNLAGTHRNQKSLELSLSMGSRLHDRNLFRLYEVNILLAHSQKCLGRKSNSTRVVLCGVLYIG